MLTADSDFAAIHRAPLISLNTPAHLDDNNGLRMGHDRLVEICLIELEHEVELLFSIIVNSIYLSVFLS